MKFLVLKASMDGMSGGAGSAATLKMALAEISYHKGWDSLQQLHESIKKWAASAKSGDVFCTPASALVAQGTTKNQLESVEVCPECDCDMLDYGDIDGVEDGDLEQHASCPQCGENWIDVFTLTDRRHLVKRKVK